MPDPLIWTPRLLHGRLDSAGLGRWSWGSTGFSPAAALEFYRTSDGPSLRVLVGAAGENALRAPSPEVIAWRLYSYDRPIEPVSVSVWGFYAPSRPMAGPIEVDLGALGVKGVVSAVRVVLAMDRRERGVDLWGRQSLTPARPDPV